MSHKEISADMRGCIDECNSCRDICTESVAHCLSLGGKHAKSDHIQMLQDCAELCAASAAFMLRGSELHGDVCGVCASACEACATSCGAFGEDDLMARCAEECRRCARSCQRMAAITSTA